MHGRNSAQAHTKSRVKDRGARVGFVYLHSAVGGRTRLAYTEPLPDEKGATVAGFFARAKVWFAAHGITKIDWIVTDNGARYRSDAFDRIISRQPRHQQRTCPFTPCHNGKVESYRRILAEELLYARPFTSENDRTVALQVWNIHYNLHRLQTLLDKVRPRNCHYAMSPTSSPHTASCRFEVPSRAG